jgi:transcriptional regulator with XRE-family HTH domain
MDKIAPYAELGEKLKSLRGDLPINEFAEILGINIRTYYRYENGERPIKKGLMRLAEIESAAAKCRVQQTLPEFETYADVEPDVEKVSGFSADSSEWRAMGKLHDLLSGENEVFKRAILANIDAYSAAEDLSKQVKTLRSENRTLSARLDAIEKELALKQTANDSGEPLDD